MLFRYAWRGLTEVSPRLNYKAVRLWVWKGLFALRAYKKRLKKGELFPPFLFFALTNACNLRCRGCWIHNADVPTVLPFEKVDRAIQESAKQGVYFHTLLGGEPFLYPQLWELIEKHPECYFQIITNGQFLTEENVARIRRLGNVSPLLSLDGLQGENDARRGEGTFERLIEGAKKLQRAKILYGIATVVTGKNEQEVVSESYVKDIIDLGAMYLWFYVYRPVGEDPGPELCVPKEKWASIRRRLLKLRRTMPIILIDTYWNAQGQAVCPAAKGLGFHIGPQGSIEPCPPLSVAREFLQDNEGDLFKTINDSRFLRAFQDFVQRQFHSKGLGPEIGSEIETARGQAVKSSGTGCVILEHPHELADFFRGQQVKDVSGRDILAELDASNPQSSHNFGEEIPEDFWLYKMLKKTLFFGMGGYA
ncbi:MAG: radical SAM/SPASM domain-containing protein [Thermoguttaceae bacterium]